MVKKKLDLSSFLNINSNFQIFVRSNVMKIRPEGP